MLIQRNIFILFNQSSYSIRFFADFSQVKKKQSHSGILIITDSQLLYVLDFKELKFHCELFTINKCEVFEEKVTVKKATTAGISS